MDESNSLWLGSSSVSEASTVDVAALKESSSRPRLVTINEDWDSQEERKDDHVDDGDLEDEDSSSCSHSDEDSSSNSSDDSDSSNWSASSDASGRYSCGRRRGVKILSSSTSSITLRGDALHRRRSRNVSHCVNSHVHHRKSSIFSSNKTQMGPPLKPFSRGGGGSKDGFNSSMPDKSKLNGSTPSTCLNVVGTKVQNRHLLPGISILQQQQFSRKQNSSTYSSPCAPLGDTKSPFFGSDSRNMFAPAEIHNAPAFNLNNQSHHAATLQESLPSLFDSSSQSTSQAPSSSRTTASLSSLESLLPEEEVLLAALDLDLDEAPSSTLSSPNDQLLTPLEAQPLQLNVSSEEEDPSVNNKINSKSNKLSLQSSRKRRYNALKASKASLNNFQEKSATTHQLVSQTNQTSHYYLSNEATTNASSGLLDSSMSPSSLTRALQQNESADIYLNQTASNVSPDSGIQSEGFSSSPLHINNSENAGSINPPLAMVGFNNTSSLMVFNPIAVSEAGPNMLSQIMDSSSSGTTQLFAPAIHFRPTSRMHPSTTAVTSSSNYLGSNHHFRATSANNGGMPLQEANHIGSSQTPLLLPNMVSSILSSSLHQNSNTHLKRRGRGRPKGSKNKAKSRTKTSECASQTEPPKLMMRPATVENLSTVATDTRLNVLSDLSSPPVPVFMATSNSCLPKRPGRPRKHPPTLEPQVDTMTTKGKKEHKRHHKSSKKKNRQLLQSQRNAAKGEVEVITIDDSDGEPSPSVRTTMEQSRIELDTKRDSKLDVSRRRRWNSSSSLSSCSTVSLSRHEAMTCATKISSTCQSPSRVEPLFDKRFSTVKADLFLDKDASKKPAVDSGTTTATISATTKAPDSLNFSSVSTSPATSSRLVTKASFKLFSGQSSNSSNAPSMKAMLNALAEVNRRLKPGRKSKKPMNRRQSSESRKAVVSLRSPLGSKMELTGKTLKWPSNAEEKRSKKRKKDKFAVKISQTKKWRTKHTNVVDPVFDSQLSTLQQALKELTINCSVVTLASKNKRGNASLPSIFEKRRITMGKNSNNNSTNKKILARHKADSNTNGSQSSAGNSKRRVTADVAEQRLPLKKRHHNLDDPKRSKEDGKNSSLPTSGCKGSNSIDVIKLVSSKSSTKGGKKAINKRTINRKGSLSLPTLDQPPKLQCEAIPSVSTFSENSEEPLQINTSLPPTLSPPHVSATTPASLPSSSPTPSSQSCYSVQRLEGGSGVKLRLQRSASQNEESSIGTKVTEEKQEPKKRGRGRPKGSTNKKKLITPKICPLRARRLTEKKSTSEDEKLETNSKNAKGDVSTTDRGTEQIKTPLLISIVKPKIRKQICPEDNNEKRDQSTLANDQTPAPVSCSQHVEKGDTAGQSKPKKLRKKRRSNRTGFPSVRPRKRPKERPKDEAPSSLSSAKPQVKKKRGRPPKRKLRQDSEMVEYEGAFKKSRLYADEDNSKDCLETLPWHEEHVEEFQQEELRLEQHASVQEQLQQPSLKAGLFSLYYKRPIHDREEENSYGKRALEYVPDEHVHGLLPPPYYCGRQLRQRRHDFELPFDLWCTRNRLKGHYNRNGQRSNFKRIPSNIYVDVRPLSAFETQPCQCNEQRSVQDIPNVCTTDRCINRMTYTECDSGMCSEHCTNNVIQRRKHLASSLELFITESKGYGVRAKEALPAGVFVLEYVGEVVSDKEFKRRMIDEYYGDMHHYCLHVHKGIFIDGHRKGNMCRFVNHSCEPNCEIQKWTVQGLYRMVLFTLRPIEEGEELTYDYNFELFNPHEGQQCLCGSSKCRGVIADKNQRVETIGNDKEDQSQNDVTNVSTRQKSSTSSSLVNGSKAETRPSNNSLAPFLAPVKLLTARELSEVRQSSCFLIRNLDKIRKSRESLNGRLKEAKKHGNNNVSEEMIKTGLTALTTARSMQTRRLACARDDPNVAKVVKLAHMLREIFARVVTINDGQGRPVARFFNLLPSKKKASDYYELLSDPIDLQSIDRNINNGNYGSLTNFVNDLLRLLQNNIRYYGHLSPEGAAAVKMRSVFHSIKSDYHGALVDAVGPQEAASFATAAPATKTTTTMDVIRCPCGQYEDVGFMIQCDQCQVWQHAHCVKWNEEAKSREDSFFCEDCGGPVCDKNIVMETQPEYAAEDEQYYVSMMRDDLQIRLGDTVYVLRASQQKCDIDDGKRDQRQASKRGEKQKVRDGSTGQRRRGRKVSAKVTTLRTDETLKTKAAGATTTTAASKPTTTLLYTTAAPNTSDLNAEPTTPLSTLTPTEESEARDKITEVLTGESPVISSIPSITRETNDDAENNNGLKPKEVTEIKKGCEDGDRVEDAVVSKKEDECRKNEGKEDRQDVEFVKGTEVSDGVDKNDVGKSRVQETKPSEEKKNEANHEKASVEYSHGGIPHKMMSPTKGPSLEAWSLSKLNYPSYKSLSSSTSLSTLDMDIFRIERLWVNGRGERFAFGHHYLRPHETFHEPTRRFFFNEVFRAPIYEVLPLDSIWRQCWVLDVAAFSKGRPIGCVERDVYICEFRVDKGARFFKKIANKASRMTPNQQKWNNNDAAFDTFDQRIKPVRNYIPSYVPDKFRSAAPGRPKGTDERRSEGVKGKSSKPKSTTTKRTEKMKKDSSASVTSTRRRSGGRQVLETTLLRLLDRFPKEERVDASYLLESDGATKRLRKKTSFGQQYVSLN